MNLEQRIHTSLTHYAHIVSDLSDEMLLNLREVNVMAMDPRYTTTAAQITGHIRHLAEMELVRRMGD